MVLRGAICRHPHDRCSCWAASGENAVWNLFPGAAILGREAALCTMPARREERWDGRQLTVGSNGLWDECVERESGVGGAQRDA